MITTVNATISTDAKKGDFLWVDSEGLLRRRQDGDVFHEFTAVADEDGSSGDIIRVYVRTLHAKVGR